MPGLTLSPELVSFLDNRIDADDADAVIAEHFQTASIRYIEDDGGYPRPDPDAHDFFDLQSHDGAPRITYTTRNKYERACISGFSGHQFTPGVGWRIAAKPAAVAQRVTKLDAKDYGRAYDVFSQACAAWLIATDDDTIRIVGGSDITDVYSDYWHCSCGRNLGDLADSCMRYDKCQDRFGLYEDNAQLAVLPCPTCDGTRGRALLWEDVDGKGWIDRIYAGPADTETMKLWARANGYTSCWSERRHGPIDRTITVPAPGRDYDAAPYLDSLMHWCRTCGTLSNEQCPEQGHWRIQLRDYMYGNNHAGWQPPCAHCGGQIDRYGHCDATLTCDGCGVYYCAQDGDGCPNGCQPCEGCERVLRDGDDCESCYRCGCDRIVSAPTLSANLGRCLCGEVLNESWLDYRTVPLTWQRAGTNYCELSGQCPDCSARHTAYRYNDGTLDMPGVRINPDAATGACYRCHAPIAWLTPSALPAIIVAPPRAASPGRLRACAAAMQAAARRRVTAADWQRITGVVALYATYADQPTAAPTPVLDRRGGAVAGCGCVSCEEDRRRYDDSLIHLPDYEGVR